MSNSSGVKNAGEPLEIWFVYGENGEQPCLCSWTHIIILPKEDYSYDRILLLAEMILGEVEIVEM